MQRFSYTPSDSFLHRMDALCKFFLLILLTLIPFVMWTVWQIAILVSIILLITLLLSSIPIRETLQVWSFFVLLGLLLVFFQNNNRPFGELLFKIGFYSVYSAGVESGLLFGLRFAAILGASYAFVITTNPRDLVIGLIALGIPYRYAWMLFVGLISVPIYEAEFIMVKEAQKIRGIKPASNPISQRIQTYRRYAMPMLAGALRRVENLAIGMDARGFGAYPDRTYIDEFRWSKSGTVVLALTVVLFVWLLVLRIKQGISYSEWYYD